MPLDSKFFIHIGSYRVSCPYKVKTKNMLKQNKL